ncbi:e05c4300-f911-4919-b47e-71c89540d9fc [Sclerotinia trifoliorum]|uniref:E05c4300-f911-4919-b47e-71c89540d9fc n=1 Tax=Sclerotinia trifoliorum TaxID=28548 RepID=A0A8H2VWN2_9HELO|nr:e05c4300-f911-4919-b47e-71c89540d9fc [Sclerotinia trifoliorum]
MSNSLRQLDIVKLYHGYDRLCTTCSKLNFKTLFRSPELDPKLQITPPPFILEDFWTTSIYCPFCRLLRHCLGIDEKTARYHRSLHQKGETRWICRVLIRGWVRILLHRSPGHHVTYQLQPTLITETTHREGKFDAPIYGPSVQLMAKENEKDIDQLSLGRHMDLLRANIKLLRSWIDSCETHHTPDCAPQTWIRDPKSPFRLIDVKRRCIVRAPAECRYLALSYCWGAPSETNKHLKLEDKTIVWLYGKNSLSNNPNIPKTIRDSIDLVFDLGERYLWVDALCIKQDDEFDRAAQIPLMSKVYGSALCTIVAGSGSNAWAGLNGVGTEPIPRLPKQYFAKIQDLDLITTQKHYQTWKYETFWETRGWTFQEMVLSKRLMIFTGSQVFFQCKKCLWCEDTILENLNPSITCESKASGDISSESHTIMDAFTSYHILVHSYTCRSLGDQSDVLNAFQGIEQHLQNRALSSKQKSLSGSFHYGIPESFFDLALIWTLPYHYPNQRRKLFPSWSWAGWNMEMGKTFRRPGVSFTYADAVRRELVWYKPAVEGSDEYVRINASELIPKENQENQITEEEKQLSVQWKSDNNSIPQHDFPRAPHILHFWTSTARLLVDRSGNQEKSISVDPSDPAILENEKMKIRDPTRGIEIGTISLNRSWRADRPDELEFMVVARACKMKYTQNKSGLYLMLIEWVDNIAYRVQMVNEPVKEDIWVGLKTEWKFISLA